MNSFDDFRATITSNVLSSIQSEVIDDINQHLDENPIEDVSEQLVWVNRSFSIAFTMKLLERYHNWLHKD